MLTIQVFKEHINNMSKKVDDGNETPDEDRDIPESIPNINHVYKIQSYYRGHLVRRNRLPNILYIIQKYLLSDTITLCKIQGH